jgi:hypothetical protein
MGPGPPGPPGPPGVSSVLGVPPFRPGTAPPHGVYVPPAPPFPQPFSGVVPVIPGHPSVYETPTPSDSPVIPSPPSQDGGIPFVAPALGTFPGVAPVPHVYQPPVPEDEEPYIPPAPSRTPTESPPPSVIPMIPGRHLVPGVPSIAVRSPSHVSQYPDRSRTPSYERRRSRSPPYPHAPPAAPTIINVTPPAAAVAPGIPTQPEAPSGPPVVQILPSPRHARDDDLEYGPEAREPRPIIVHPQPPAFPPGVPMGYPPGAFPQPVVLPGAMSPSRSPTPSRSPRSPRSPIPLRESYPPQPPSVMVGPPGAGVMPMPMGHIPTGVPAPVTVLAPRPYEPEYRRSPTPESPGPYYPSRAPTRYSERPIQPIQPVSVAPIPSAVHIMPAEPYPTRYRQGRYPGSITPPSERSLSPEGRERPRSPVYPVPPSRGPSAYDRAGVPPRPVTHITPGSPSILSRSLAEEPEPLRHPVGFPPSQFPPPQPIPVPIDIPPSTRPRPHRVPTVIEATPEPIYVHPPDHARAESIRKYCMSIIDSATS